MTFKPTLTGPATHSPTSLLNTSWSNPAWPEAAASGDTFRLYIGQRAITGVPAGTCRLCLGSRTEGYGNDDSWYQEMLRVLRPSASIVLLSNAQADAQEATALMGLQFTTTLPAFAPSKNFGYNDDSDDWLTLAIGSKGYGRRPSQSLGVLPVELGQGETMDLESGPPKNLIREVLDYFSEPGDVVFDPRVTNETIGRTCIIENRRYVGILDEQGELAKVAERLNQAEALL